MDPGNQTHGVRLGSVSYSLSHLIVYYTNIDVYFCQLTFACARVCGVGAHVDAEAGGGCP